jgi:hypothetical protein
MGSHPIFNIPLHPPPVEEVHGRGGWLAKAMYLKEYKDSFRKPPKTCLVPINKVLVPSQKNKQVNSIRLQTDPFLIHNIRC